MEVIGPPGPTHDKDCPMANTAKVREPVSKESVLKICKTFDISPAELSTLVDDFDPQDFDI